MHYYGDILVAFHGKAKNLQKLAQLVWKRPDLEELADGLNGIHAVDGDAASTITVNLGIDCLNAELPCIDFLANHGSGVEIAVIAGSMTLLRTQEPNILSSIPSIGNFMRMKKMTKKMMRNTLTLTRLIIWNTEKIMTVGSMLTPTGYRRGSTMAFAEAVSTEHHIPHSIM